MVVQTCVGVWCVVVWYCGVVSGVVCGLWCVLCGSVVLWWCGGLCGVWCGSVVCDGAAADLRYSMLSARVSKLY